MGGKDEVIRRFEQRTKDPRNGDEFYLVDGDFDELLNRQVPSDPRFYRLTRYDIECFLVEEQAICQIAQDEGPKRSYEDYRITIDFVAWLNQVINAAIRLVASFVLLRELGMSPIGGTSNIERFMSGNESLPDCLLIEDYIRCTREEQSLLTDEEFDTRLQSIIDRMGSSAEERLRWISGKHILLPLVIRVLKRESRRNLSRDSLSFRLISYCQLGSLSELRERILHVLDSAP